MSNYPVANRNTMRNLMRMDLERAGSEDVKYMATKNFGFNQKRRDDLNPYWLRGWQDEEER